MSSFTSNGVFGLVVTVVNALFLRPQVPVITLSLLQLLSSQVLQNKITKDAIRRDLRLFFSVQQCSSPHEQSISFPYFAEFTGQMSFIEFYIVT